MQIKSLKIENYRSIQNLELSFSDYYVALSGKNNSGKSNVIRALRTFFSEDTPFTFYEKLKIDAAADKPKWLAKDATEDIRLTISLLIFQKKDGGLFRFITEFLSLDKEKNGDQLELEITSNCDCKTNKESLSIKCNGIEIPDEFKAAEIKQKIGRSATFVFHNSVQHPMAYLGFQRSVGELGTLSQDEKKEIEKTTEKLVKQLTKSALRQQKEMIELIGRLEEKYHVSLRLPDLDLKSLPLSISLGEKDSTISLQDWGSGTQNRTAILMTLLRAKKASELLEESERITPVVVIEEPESFLHPSAQAEFGRMLQDLAQEFQVQVFVTTHSPYMLSLQSPVANILLARRMDRARMLGTMQIPTEGANWMEPFGRVLGIDNDAFEAWRNILFRPTQELLLVEGDLDVEYVNILRDEIHGESALKFKGEVFPYGGVGFFANTVLLKFVLGRYKRVLITFDLDRRQEVEKSLLQLSLKLGKDFVPVGLDKPGYRDIEGLLPDAIRATVYAKHPDLVTHAQSAEKDRDKARRQLKRLHLDEFKLVAKPKTKDFAGLYELTKSLNKALAS
jgi:putative ATP-dependent endonuclease of the OLD family